MSVQEKQNDAELAMMANVFYCAATPEEGADAFTHLVGRAREIETFEQTRVERVAGVIGFLKPKTDMQRQSINLARRQMGLEGPALV